MVSRVESLGSGVAIALDAEVAARFGLAQGAEVEVLVEEDRIVVIPRRARAERLAAVAEEVLAEHDETFRRLAQ